ncbi:aspartate racemase [Aspergillus sclerotiicarbonarius CBS 121057]|uniref:Aspartate racemase n=1 Tax=Aspergillus sclerotiicarbonarius (strain CBS 121057 / IBT 28362) TaxID=1448318 RepID=A0A319F3Q7_ASPSB|nr:aspartate racemase [Aspergillus sclerotiicarbonarius CBS 121057]
MKTIGIVGGIAWPSTLVYYRAINEYFRERTNSNGLHTPNLVLVQTDFALIEKAQVEGNWDEVGRILAGAAQKLKAAGADFFLLACNTVYAADGYIIKNTDLPMLHIVDAAAQKAVERDVKTVGLLGSRYTMTGTYFVGRLKQYGLGVLVAQGQHEENVHNALYGELAKNVFRPETRAKFKAAIADLVDRGAEVIILGCTEFGILVHHEDSEVPIIDTSIAHVEAAVDLALSK